MKDLWVCPACARPFANRNQSHSCGEFSVESFLEGKDADAVELFREFVAFLRTLGPLTLAPAKTRVGFQTRMIFAAVNAIGKRGLRAHLILARRATGGRFFRIESIGGRHVHHFRVRHPDELDDDLRAWLREAYRVGEQRCGS